MHQPSQQHHDAVGLSTGQSGSARTLLRSAIRGAAPIWLAAHLVITAIGLVANAVQPDRTAFSLGRGFFRLFAQWDTEHFHQIARWDYFDESTAQKVQAFFPGYPVAARWLAKALGLGNPSDFHYYLALWLIPLVSSLVAGVLIWMLSESQYGRPTAATATLLFFAGPYSVFLVASYSEALFLAFAIAAYFAATRDRWLAAGILTGVASFVRINAVFLLAALAVMFVVRSRAQGRRILRRQLAYLALGVTGVLAYFVYLYFNTGSWSAWSEAQYIGWYRQFTMPWQSLQTSWTFVTSDHYTLDNRVQFAADIAFAAFFVASVVYMLWRRLWPEATYVGLTAASLMTSVSYMSVARNSLTLFPLLVVLASVLVKHRCGRDGGRSGAGSVAYWSVLVLSVAMMIYNTWSFALGYWTD